MTPARLVLLLVFIATLVAVPSAAGSNSPNMRLDYSLTDTFQNRTHSDIAFWGNIGVAGNYDAFRVFTTDTHPLPVSFMCGGPQNAVSLYPANHAHPPLFLSN